MRIAIIGAGLIGARRAAVLTAAGDSLQIVADVDEQRAKAAAEGTAARTTTRWEEAVAAADVDACIVATPPKYAVPVSMAAVSHGKHVLCEKPLGRNPAEAAALVAAAHRAGVILKTGFNHRHHRGIEIAHRIVTAGEIGEPLFSRAVYGHGGRPGYEQEWRGDAELSGGGEMLDQGVHVIDLARWFLGDFTEVSGFVATWFWQIAPLEDNGFAMMRTANGRIATLHTSWTQWKNRFSFEVFGRDGYVRIEGLGGSYGTERLTVGRRRPASGPPDERTEDFDGPDESWRREWTEFTAAIAEKREPLGSGEDGYQALRLVEAIYTSSRERRVIDVGGIDG